MKQFSDVFTIGEIDEMLDRICGKDTDLRRRVSYRTFTESDRASSWFPQIESALKRRDELQQEIADGIRDTLGFVNIQV